MLWIDLSKNVNMLLREHNQCGNGRDSKERFALSLQKKKILIVQKRLWDAEVPTLRGDYRNPRSEKKRKVYKMILSLSCLVT